MNAPRTLRDGADVRRPTDVEVRRPPELDDRAPQRRPLLGGPVAAGRLVRQHRAAQTARRRVARLGDRDVGVVQREVGHPDESVGRVRAEVGEPAVVRGEARAGEVGIAAREWRAHSCTEEHLGVHAVDVLVLDARTRLPPARAHLVEAAHTHRVLLGATARRRRQRHHRPALSLEHLEVTLVGPLHRRRAIRNSAGRYSAHMSAGGLTCESAETARNTASLIVSSSGPVVPETGQAGTRAGGSAAVNR